MSNLNLLVLNLGKLNLSRARLEELARSLNGSAYGGYVKDGLIFQLDCKKGIKTVSDCDDAARTNWGGDWRTPTYDEWQELIDNCTWEWIGSSDSKIQFGWLVTGSNGNSIFLPSSGWYGDRVYLGAGFYWSSTLRNSYTLVFLEFTYSHHMLLSGGTRYWGYPVRPVSETEGVDLGLSVKWADCNVGASSPGEYGDYFAWGETETKDEYTIGNYKWYDSDAGEYTKYNSTDGLTTLQLSYNEHTNWTDLIQKAICEGTTTFETTAGVVFDGENYFANPYSPEDEVVVEIAEKSGEELETTYAEELATNIGEGCTGTIYEIRVYLKSAYTDETKAKNALIDQNRFGDAPANALVDADGTYLLDKDGYYIISND